MLPVIGLLIGVQSLCLYSAVARLPVALALLAFNTYPIWTALWSFVVYRKRGAGDAGGHAGDPGRLALALDVFGAASGWAPRAVGAHRRRRRLRAGGRRHLRAGAGADAARAGDVDGRVRTATTMSIAGLVALAMVVSQGGFRLPTAPAGWGGLVTLTVLYGTAFTMMFTVLPRLGVVGNSAIMNVEPVFALVLAWLILGQAVAPVQVAGALLVVGAVMALGLRKR
jgi:drug/metabolite transporter (DMT)-like permease